MNTQEYLNELKIQLRKMPDEDREDAISYYFEYLAEAGPDGAEEAMEKLGTPAQLAAGIRADKAMEDFAGASGFAVKEGVEAVWTAGTTYRASVPRTILAVFVTAIIIVVFFAVMIALFAVAIGLVGGGVIAIVGGAYTIFFALPFALMGIGGGLVVFALGILFFRLAVWCSKHLLLAIAQVFNGIRLKREYKRVDRNYVQDSAQDSAQDSVQDSVQENVQGSERGGEAL